MRRFLASKARRRRALSLVEVIFASAILLGVSAATTLLYIRILRVEKQNLAMLSMAFDTANLNRELRRVASSGGLIDVVNGDTIFFTPAGGSPSRLIYIDEDGDNTTIQDNRIELITTDEDGETQARAIVQNISRLPGPGGTLVPVFRRTGARSPIYVEFRVGDRINVRNPQDRANNSDARAEDRFTGPGFQSMVFRGAYGARNIST